MANSNLIQDGRGAESRQRLFAIAPMRKCASAAKPAQQTRSEPLPTARIALFGWFGA